MGRDWCRFMGSRKILKERKMKKKFYDLEKHGVTFSLLSKFLACRKMTRLALQGWTSRSIYSEGLTFGSIFHGIDEAVRSDIKKKKIKSAPDAKRLKKYSTAVEKLWLKENPKPNRKSLQILENMFAIAEKTYPLYLDYWKKDDFKKYEWKAVEKEFCHIVKIGKLNIPVRGKRDGDIYKKGLRLFETKTKSQISEINLLDTLWYDMQTNMYLWSMRKDYGVYPKGCIYNIVRRTCLKQKVNESLKDFSDRIYKDIQARPDFYFIRYKLDILKSDQNAFENELMSIIENYVEWYLGWKDYKNTGSCITKYGRCAYVPICSEEDYVPFVKRDRVFGELEGIS